MIRAPLPTLRVVPFEQCVLHEETDASRVSRLAERLASEAVLRNPPILGRHPDIEPFIVLDGSTRVTALRAAGVEQVIAQVVDYAHPAIHLELWEHLLINTSPERFVAALEQDHELRLQRAPLHEATAALEQHEALALIVLAGEQCLVLEQRRSLVAQADLLRRLFRLYAGQATIVRVPESLWREQFTMDGADAAIIFPRYSKQDLAMLAQAGAILPAGVTRHVIPGRVLHINMPLRILQEAGSLAEKQSWVDQWLDERWTAQRVRYYEEPTFLFDE